MSLYEKIKALGVEDDTKVNFSIEEGNEACGECMAVGDAAHGCE